MVIIPLNHAATTNGEELGMRKGRTTLSMFWNGRSSQVSLVMSMNNSDEITLYIRILTKRARELIFADIGD